MSPRDVSALDAPAIITDGPFAGLREDEVLARVKAERAACLAAAPWAVAS